LFVQDEPTDHVVVIWDGYAKVLSRDGCGRQVLLAIRGPAIWSVNSPVSRAVGGWPRWRRSTRCGRCSSAPARSGCFSPGRRTGRGRPTETSHHSIDGGGTAAGGAAPGPCGAVRCGRVLRYQNRSWIVPGGSRGVRWRVPRTVAREIGRWRDRGIVTTGRRNFLFANRRHCAASPRSTRRRTTRRRTRLSRRRTTEPAARCRWRAVAPGIINMPTAGYAARGGRRPCC
jgi:hypothetical protein